MTHYYLLLLISDGLLSALKNVNMSLMYIGKAYLQGKGATCTTNLPGTDLSSKTFPPGKWMIIFYVLYVFIFTCIYICVIYLCVYVYVYNIYICVFICVYICFKCVLCMYVYMREGYLVPTCFTFS